MATKKPKSYNLYVQQHQQKFANALEQAKAIAAAEAESSGTAFSDAQIQDIARQLARKGSFDLAIQPEVEEINTPVAEAVVEEPEEQGYFGGLVDALQGSVQRTLGNAAVALPRLAASAEDRLVGEVPTIGGVRLTPSGGLDALLSGTGQELRDAADANSRAAQVQYKALEDANPVVRWFGEGALDVAESGASGAASLIGGPAALLPIGDVFAQEYNKAKEKGLSDQEARAWAMSQSAPEAVGFVPAGKFLERLPGVNRFMGGAKRAIADRATARLAPSIVAAMRTAKTAVGEGAEETVTGSLQDLAAAAIAGAEQGELSKLGQEEAPKSLDEFAENRKRDFRAGLLMGGGLGAPSSVRSAYRDEAVAQEQDADAFASAGLQGFVQEEANNREAQAVKEQERQRAEQIPVEIEEAFASRERELAEQEARKAIEEEAAFRTMEAERAAGDRLERYGTSDLPEELGRGKQVLERVPNQPGPEITPEQVAAEQEAAAEQERVAREQEELASYNAVLLREMEAERKRKEKEEAKKTSQQKAEERKRQREVARQLLAENPGKDITELAPLLRERLAQPAVEEAPAPKVSAVEERVASVRNRLSAAAKARQTRQDNERLKSLVRRNPNATDAEIAAMFEGRTVPETAQIANTSTPSEPVAPVVTTGDNSVDNFLTTLNMESPTPEALQSAEVNVEEFQQKLRDLGKRLSARRTREAVDTQNLVRSGKLVVAPNAASIGRSDNAPAVYDTATGKMYMYTDNLTDGDDVGAMVAALHEATHAGQFNDRDGRDSILRSIMGQERYDAAQSRVRAIARKQIREGKQGPERAAVEAALSAALANPNFNGDVEALEVMPYYVGEAARRRADMSGVRSVAKEVVGAGRKFLRDNLGMDLDVTMQDIDYAARRVGGEIVETELTPSQDDGQLEMVVGGRFTNDPRQRYKGAIDGLERYVISDADSVINTDLASNLQSGQMVRLGDLLNHDRLYELYPQLSEVRVVLDDDQKGYGAGVFNPNTGEIGLSEESVANLDMEDIRNTILHETQHAVQHIEGFMQGTNPEYLMSPMYQQDMDKARAVRERAVNQFDLGRWKQTTSPKTLAEFNAAVADKGVAGDRYQESLLVLQNGWNKDSTDRIVQRYDTARYIPVRDALNGTIRAYNAERKRAMDLYMRNYGETEARTTEYASRMTQQELDRVSFEDLFPEAKGNVNVDDTLDTGGFYQGRRPNEARNVADTSWTDKPSSELEQDEEFLDWLTEVAVYRGNPAELQGAPRVSDGALGPGVYVTGVRQAAEGYGPNVAEFTLDTVKPLVVKMSDAENTAEAIVKNPKFVNENFYSNAGAIRWAREQWDDWAGIGDPEFPQMLRDAGYDSVVLLNENGEIVEANVLTPRKLIPAKRSTTLEMATQSTPEQVKQRKLPMWFYNLFDSSKGVARDINAAVEAAAASPAGDYMLAEKTVGKYQTALRKLASSRGTTYDKLNKQIETELAQLKPQGSWAANKQEFNKVVSKYGDAGKQLMDLRDQIDGLSMEMLKQRAAQGGSVTEAEKKSYKAIAANLGYYTNRQYAALTGKAGKEFAEKVWNDYERYKRGGKKDPVRKKNYEIVAKAVKRLVDDSLRIPDDVGIADMSADQLRRMYATWVGPAGGVNLDDIRTELANRRDLINGDKNRLNNEAEAIAYELLGLVDATRPVTDFFRGAKLDKGILQERSHMPQEIRDLLGEITDPAMKMLLTVGKQAEFTARNKLLLDLRNHVGRDIQPPDAAGTPQVRGMSVLKGELWGPLEGYYASPNMQALVGDMVQQIATFEQAMALAAVRPSVLNDKVVTEALGKWGKAASATKMLQIVASPMNFVYNYVGAYLSMLSNGNVNPVNVAKAHKAMYELMRYAGDSTTAGDEARRMNSLGITDSAFIGEIKSGQYRSLQKLIKEMSGKDLTLPQARARLEHAKAVGTEGYAMMDVWGKMANFYQQVDVLTDFYKKNGDKKTAEEIDREAADIVNRTNITYKRAAPIIKAAEKAGITQFGTYFYEVFRSQAANLAQGVDEYNRARTAKTPEARNAMLLQASKRIGGQVALWNLLGYASSLLNSAVFGDDDEEAEKKRKLLQEYQRDQDFVQVGTDANGKPILFNVSRFDPIGPATDFMRTIMHGEMTGEELGKKLLDLYVAPRLAGQLYKAVDATVSDGRITRTPSTQQWFPEVYGYALRAADIIPGVDDKATRGWTNVLEMFVLPGASNALRDTNPKVTDNEANAAFFGMMRFMGLSLAAVDADKATGFAAREYNDTLKAVHKDVADLFRDRPNVTEAEALEKVLEFTDDERKAAKKLSDIYQGMLAMGKSEKEAMAIFKEQKVPTTVIRTIANGNYVPQTISQKSIKAFADREMQGKTLAEKREIKQKWDNVWEILSQVDAKIKESE